MIFIYILLIAVGALPLIIFLVKRKRYRNILNNGTQVTAVVTDKRLTRYTKGPTIENVYFAYLPVNGSQYFTGQITTSVGKHKKGDQLEICYLPADPKKHAVPGSKGETAFLIFTILILLFTIFASYKIHEMVKTGNIS